MPELTASSAAPRRRRSGAVRTGQLPKYETNLQLTIAQRVAHFLDWAVKFRPYEFIAYNELTREVLGYNHTPRPNHQDVTLVKGAVSRSKKILFEQYHRDQLSKRSVGVRATVDANDRVIKGLTIKAENLQRAAAQFKNSAADINPAEVTDPEAKRWFTHGVKQLCSTIGDPSWQKQLTPPAPDEE
jgi:hypothetical protein